MFSPNLSVKSLAGLNTANYMLLTYAILPIIAAIAFFIGYHFRKS